MIVKNFSQNFYLIMVIFVLFSEAGCMMRLPMVVYYDSKYWHMAANEKNNLNQRVNTYIQEHPLLPEQLKDALLKKKVIRGMNKEQIILLVGPPEQIISKAEGSEIWWYEVRDTHCLFYLFPLGWPWLLLHPQNLFDCKERDEFYWREDVLQDLKSYRVEVL